MTEININKNLQKETLVDRIVDIIEKRILSGEIPPKTRLSEPKVALEFKVSRIPAREALNRLEEMDLIQKNHLGRMVKIFELKEFSEIYELKNVLEAYCIEKAALKATEKDHKKLTSLINDMERNLNPKNQKKRRELNIQFHDHMVNCSQNNKFIETYQLYAKKVRWANLYALQIPDRPRLAFEEHREILNAFNNRDGEKARRLMENHTNRIREVVLEQLKIKKIFE